MPIASPTPCSALLASLSLTALLSLASVDAAEVLVQIDDGTVVHRTDATFSGTNLCALWNPTADSPGTRKAAAQLNLDLIRFPGGVPAHWWDWEQPGATGESKFTCEMVSSMARESGAKVMFQTNTCTDNPAKHLITSGEHAAAWVAYAKRTGIDVAWWEIGNEPENDGPGRENLDNLFVWYNAKFTEQAKAMKAVDPSTKVMGPSSTNTWFWMNQHCVEKFMAAHGNKKGDGLVDAVSIHWYPDGGHGSWPEKRGIAQSWAGCYDYLRNQAIAPYDDRPLPLYITEWNWGGGMDNPSCRQLGNALGCADIIGMYLRTGVNGHTHFVLQGTQGWGLLGENYDPTGENRAMPTYFSLSMANRLRGEVLATTCSVDEANVVSAYATRDADGRIAVMLINKSDAVQSASLAFSRYVETGKAIDSYTLSGVGAQAADTEVVYNGVRAPNPAADALPPPTTTNAEAKKDALKRIAERQALAAKKDAEEQKKAAEQKALEAKMSPYELKQAEQRRAAKAKRDADEKLAAEKLAAAKAKQAEAKKPAAAKVETNAKPKGPASTHAVTLQPMSLTVLVFWP